MIGFVCIDGTGVSSDQQYAIDYYNSHTMYVRDWGLCYGPSVYQRGPDYAGTQMWALAKWGFDRAMEIVSSDDCQGLILAGHSRGGAALIESCHRLKEQGVTVDFLALFDLVDRTYQSSGSSGLRVNVVPSNVKVCRHARRDPRGRSRPFWGNCGTRATGSTDYLEKFFFCTHGGVGGAPWVAHDGQSPHDFIYESPELTSSAVTFGIEAERSPSVRQWITPFLFNAIDEILTRTSDPGVGPLPPGGGTVPGRPKPGPGQGGGGAGSKYHIVAKGESLSLIAGKYWGDVLLWPLIYDVNKTQIDKNWNLIQPGWKLLIPSLSGYSSAQLAEARTRGKNW